MTAAPDDSLFDLAVIGGGMVGAAIAYGAAKRGARALLLDEGDIAHRAARGNFGLVWSQTKGEKMPAYNEWSRESRDRWSELAGELAPYSDGDVGFRRSGGIVFCIGEKELEERRALLQRMHNVGSSDDVRLVDRQELQDLLPESPLGPQVLGASYAPQDGHTNPLRLLRGLVAAFRDRGGTHRPGPPVDSIAPEASGFRISRADGTWRSARVAIAAGVNTTPLARQIGLDVPVRPVRGQNIVSERMRMVLRMPASALRQTTDGQIQIGVSNEEVGFDERTTIGELSRMAARACTVLPVLRGARMIRAWGALRPMTPDGFPVYVESPEHRGGFVAACHSGVTLAPMHAGPLVEAMLGSGLGTDFESFHPRRFAGSDVRATSV